MLRGFNIDIPPRDKRSGARSGTAITKGKVSRSVETITRFLHDFANFNERRKKKKEKRLRSFLRKR